MRQRRAAASTATQLCVALPVAPSVNEQYFTDPQGYRRLAPVALRYKDEVRKILRKLEEREILNASLITSMRTGYLAIYLECYFETPLKRDIDGGIKIVIDSLAQALGINDNRVVDLHVTKRIRPLDPYFYLEIDVLAPDEWEFDEDQYVVFPAPEREQAASA
jgi:crossover junction endodeoxyribonuclease RusA